MNGCHIPPQTDKMSPKLQKMKVLGIKETAGKHAGPYKVPPTHYIQHISGITYASLTGLQECQYSETSMSNFFDSWRFKTDYKLVQTDYKENPTSFLIKFLVIFSYLYNESCIKNVVLYSECLRNPTLYTQGGWSGTLHTSSCSTAFG